MKRKSEDTLLKQSKLKLSADGLQISTHHQQSDHGFHAIIYKAVFQPNEPHPLSGCVYIGQAARYVESPAALFVARQKEHISLSSWKVKKEKPLNGFHLLLVTYPNSFKDWKIIEDCPEKIRDQGPIEIQRWANERETALIAKFGGILKDVDDPNRKQTLNLQCGGKGDPATAWKCLMVRSDKQWKAFWESINKFKEQHGHCKVSRACTLPCGETTLANAVTSVRANEAYIKGHPKRRQMLLNIGFVFNMHDESWECFYKALKEFHSQHGHSEVPFSDTTPLNHKTTLGSAVSTVRLLKVYVENRPDRIKMLDDLGFVWKSCDQKDRLKSLQANGERDFLLRFDACYELLKDFKQKHGHCRVPLSISVACGRKSSFGKSIFRLRHEDQKYLAKYPDKVHKLQELGFEFGDPRKAASDAAWDALYTCLLKYQVKHGHLRVARHDKTFCGDTRASLSKNSILGNSVAGVRAYNTFIKANPARLRALLDLPGWLWSAKKGNSGKNFQ